MVKQEMIFGPFPGNIIFRHHIQPRVKLYVPREESLPIPQRYFDVIRATSTTLDVTHERHVDDYWNIERNRDLSDSWTGFTRFTMFDEKPPCGYAWSGRRLTKKQTTSRPRKEKQKWAIEQPKLDNARRLRGIFFIDPDDAEFKETLKNARRKLDVPMPPGMPCKIRRRKYKETSRTPYAHKTKYACIVGAGESTRKRLEGTLHKDHEDHIAGKGINSLNHYILVHKCMSIPKAMKIPDAKATVDKEWWKLEDLPGWHLTKVRNKKEVIDEARTKGAKVHFASLMDICHLKNAELEAEHQKYKGRVVLRGDIVKDDSGSYAVFTEQGSSASQMTAAKVMDVMARLPGCAGQANLDTSTKTQMAQIMVQHGRSSRSS